MGLELGLGLVLGGLASWSPQARPHLYKLVRVRVRVSSTSCLRPAAYSAPPPAVYHPRWQRTLNQLFPQLGVTVRKEGWLSKRGEGGAAKFTKRWCVHHRTIRCRCMRMHTHTPCTRRAHAHAHAVHTSCTCPPPCSMHMPQVRARLGLQTTLLQGQGPSHPGHG